LLFLFLSNFGSYRTQAKVLQPVAFFSSAPFFDSPQLG
jgi:hypothetical protein